MIKYAFMAVTVCTACFRKDIQLFRKAGSPRGGAMRSGGTSRDAKILEAGSLVFPHFGFIFAAPNGQTTKQKRDFRLPADPNRSCVNLNISKNACKNQIGATR